MRWFSCFLLLVCTLSLQAQDRQPQVFAEHKPIILTFELSADTDTKQQFVRWIADRPQLSYRTATDSKTTVYCWASPGEYILRAEVTTVTLLASEAGKPRFTVEFQEQLFPLKVISAAPQPDPTPNPDPTPPPKPVRPSINPVGFTVLFLKEASDFSLPEKVLQTLNSTRISEYLNRVCAKESSGYVAWRRWDDDYPEEALSGHPSYWKEAYKQAKADSDGKRPWLFISTKTEVISVALPATEEETLTLLKKYGGA